MKKIALCLSFAAAVLLSPPSFADCAVPQSDSDTPSCQSDVKSDTKSDSTSKPTDKSADEGKLVPEFVRVTRPRSYSGGMPSAAVRVKYVPLDELEQE